MPQNSHRGPRKHNKAHGGVQAPSLVLPGSLAGETALCQAHLSPTQASAAEVLGEERRTVGPQSVQGGGSLAEVALGNPVPLDTVRQGLFPLATWPVCAQRGSAHVGPPAPPASAPGPAQHLMMSQSRS